MAMRPSRYLCSPLAVWDNRGLVLLSIATEDNGQFAFGSGSGDHYAPIPFQRGNMALMSAISR